MAVNESGLVMYHLNDNKKEKQLMELCKQLGISTRKIKENDVNVSLSALAGISGVPVMAQPEKAPHNYVMPELLIFSGLADGKLDEFLAEYRKKGIEPVSLKAMITAHNISWTVYQLVSELVKERAAILMGRQQ